MTILKKVKGGWINIEHEDLFYKKEMITQERKSKYKHKVMFKGGMDSVSFSEMRGWCEQSFGPGGRSKNLRWRVGWTEKDNVFYFKFSKDAMMFTLRFSDAG